MESVPSVKYVIYNAALRFKLSCEHIHRAVAQENRIAEYFREFLERSAHTYAIIIMDYKKIFEPIRYSETSVELCGKRGISWHGSVVLFHREHDEATVGDDLGTIALNHIAENENAQDSWAVLSVVGTVMDRIKQGLPTVTSTWIVTDNSRNYQNHMLPVVAPFLNASYSVLLNELVHSETARGEGFME